MEGESERERVLSPNPQGAKHSSTEQYTRHNHGVQGQPPTCDTNKCSATAAQQKTEKHFPSWDWAANKNHTDRHNYEHTSMKHL